MYYNPRRRRKLCLGEKVAREKNQIRAWIFISSSVVIEPLNADAMLTVKRKRQNVKQVRKNTSST